MQPVHTSHLLPCWHTFPPPLPSAASAILEPRRRVSTGCDMFCEGPFEPPAKAITATIPKIDANSLTAISAVLPGLLRGQTTVSTCSCLSPRRVRDER